MMLRFIALSLVVFILTTLIGCNNNETTTKPQSQTKMVYTKPFEYQNLKEFSEMGVPEGYDSISVHHGVRYYNNSGYLYRELVGNVDNIRYIQIDSIRVSPRMRKTFEQRSNRGVNLGAAYIDSLLAKR